MHRRWGQMLLLVSVLTGLGANETEPEELKHHRQQLERWRADKEHYQRLLQDLKAFQALPQARQEQLRALDRDLHQEEITRQTQLWAVLDRYLSWLEQLPPSDRQRIQQAEDQKVKLRLIREIRDRQWVDKLPARIRDEVRALPAPQRTVRIQQLREADRRQRNLWRTGTLSRDEPTLRPTSFQELPSEVRTYLQQLEKRLTVEEKARLKQAEGKWPDYPRTIRELAELHPILPPLPSGPITTYADLPPEIKTTLQRVERRKLKALQRHSGRWPEFAWEVTKLLQREKLPGVPLGASRLDEFPAETKSFVQNKLLPRLGPFQLKTLVSVEGRWPDYPLQLLRLARDRRLVIPGMSLPGPPDIWENARAAIPEVPDHLLMHFALHESSPEERAGWELDTRDPMGSREKVKRAWYRHKLGAQQRHPQTTTSRQKETTGTTSGSR